MYKRAWVKAHYFAKVDAFVSLSRLSVQLLFAKCIHSSHLLLCRGYFHFSMLPHLCTTTAWAIGHNPSFDPGIFIKKWTFSPEFYDITNSFTTYAFDNTVFEITPSKQLKFQGMIVNCNLRCVRIAWAELSKKYINEYIQRGCCDV